MLPKQIVRMYTGIRKSEGRLLRIFLFYFFRLFKINHNKIVFSCFYGNGFGDNPKYIVEEIIRQNLNYDLVWLLREEIMDKHTLPSQVRPVNTESIRAIYELATAMVWVDNVMKPEYIKKRKGQLYIQTAHGGPSLKRLEQEEYIRECKTEAKKIDLFLSNSTWYSSLVKNVLWYNGEMLECGTPRNDIFFDQNTSSNEKVRNYFGINDNQKIVLYAPTWRDNYDLNVYNLDVDSCLKSLWERFSGDWILMIRLHPNMHKSLGFSDGSNVKDATQYEDVQELLSVVDAVVTDYSSIMFDFAIRRLPVFLYTPDIDHYRQERGFYFDFQDLPFTSANNNAALSKHIKEFNMKTYIDQVNSFFSQIGTYENGAASKTIVNRIVSHKLLMGRTVKPGNAVDGEYENGTGAGGNEEVFRTFI